MADGLGQSVLAIGSFDGVHLGHAALIRRARARADAHPTRPPVRALVFDPHPMTVLAPRRAPARLSTFEQRARWLRALGADEIIRLEPTPDLLCQTPGEFVKSVCAQHAPIAIVEGEDFRFGQHRAGDVETLAVLGAQHGFGVEVIAPIEAALSDQALVRVSSSMVRWLVTNGRVDDAARLLGRRYEVVGTVVRGDRRGRELGFPTANVETQSLLPRDGVYTGMANLPDGTERAAAIHVGPRATFDASARTLEAHVLDWSWPAPGAPEYGWTMRLRFQQFLRDQAKFDGIESLVQQILRDVERTRTMVGDRAHQEIGA